MSYITIGLLVCAGALFFNGLVQLGKGNNLRGLLSVVAAVVTAVAVATK